MPARADAVIAEYSTPMGLIFIFNLIVGTGALAMPKAFQDAGYVFGLITIAVLSFMSYISLTFVLESMSAANAVLQSVRAGKLKILAIQFASNEEGGRDGARSMDRSASTSLLSSMANSPHVPPVTRPQFFEITQRVEFGRMASMFLNRWGVRFFYACLVIYLYGDLSIYATAVPKSMMNVVCTYRSPTDGHNGTLCSSLANMTNDQLCWSNAGRFWTRFTVYRFFVAAFALVIGPWVFFNVSKTKYLQTFSTVSRWIAFLLMISLASLRLIRRDPGLGHPPMANGQHFGNLFGICVYAFMCHHSLPSVITPMKSKTHIFPLIGVVYTLILSFYIALSTTGSFAFSRVMDVYTLNFLHQCNEDSGGGDTDSGPAHILLLIIEYFLALFPVFTLSMTFPVVGITLRNNIQGLLFPNYGKSSSDKMVAAAGAGATSNDPRADASRRNKRQQGEDEDGEDESFEDPAVASGDSRESASLIVPPSARSARHVCVRLAHDFLVPCMVLLIPLSVALATDNVEILTSVTGSYAGVGVQYAMPSLLVWGVRKRLPKMLGESVPSNYTSPFKHTAWVGLVFAWAMMTVLVVTLNHVFAGL